METKKTRKADLSNKKGLFFSIGLLATLILVSSAFEWRQNDKQLNLLANKSTNAFEEIIEVPPTDIPPPPTPVIQQPQIIEVPDEEEIKEDLNIKFDVEAPRIELTSSAVIEPTAEETDEIFTIVEENAMPQGGMLAFYKYLVDNMRYPALARRNNIEGKVLVQFVVGKDGAISDVKVLKGIGAGCDQEAVRVMEKAPSWKPGKQRGKAVRQRCIIPLSFQI